ncbi:MAG TPA: MOSC N-terminal beta barrel domain-containing protein [Candidatus Paceibacterota bacterium]|nr:MOSC N-terminal beta barrel domain-containing protein [Candidatus Paceibacterota bacterium]
MPKIAELYIYPIKSCGGIPVDRAVLTPSGFEHDREFVLIDSNGAFLSQRKVPKMCLIRTSICNEWLEVMTADYDDRLIIPLSDGEGEKVEVDIWGRVGRGIDMGDRPSRWFEKNLGVPCRLLQYDPTFQRKREDPRGGNDIPLSFADGYPLLLISQASLDDLNSRTTVPIPMNRFRPNIVVTDCDPYAEDGWDVIDTTEATLKGGKLCVRCPIPTIDQETGLNGKEPLLALSKYRRLPALPGIPVKGVVFGKNFACLHHGGLEIGDILEVA